MIRPLVERFLCQWSLRCGCITISLVGMILAAITLLINTLNISLMQGNDANSTLCFVFFVLLTAYQVIDFTFHLLLFYSAKRADVPVLRACVIYLIIRFFLDAIYLILLLIWTTNMWAAIYCPLQYLMRVYFFIVVLSAYAVLFERRRTREEMSKFDVDDIPLTPMVGHGVAPADPGPPKPAIFVIEESPDRRSFQEVAGDRQLSPGPSHKIPATHRVVSLAIGPGGEILVIEESNSSIHKSGKRKKPTAVLGLINRQKSPQLQNFLLRRPRLTPNKKIEPIEEKSNIYFTADKSTTTEFDFEEQDSNPPSPQNIANRSNKSTSIESSFAPKLRTSLPGTKKMKRESILSNRSRLSIESKKAFTSSTNKSTSIGSDFIPKVIAGSKKLTSQDSDYGRKSTGVQTSSSMSSNRICSLSPVTRQPVRIRYSGSTQGYETNEECESVKSPGDSKCSESESIQRLPIKKKSIVPSSQCRYVDFTVDSAGAFIVNDNKSSTSRAEVQDPCTSTKAQTSTDDIKREPKSPERLIPIAIGTKGDVIVIDENDLTVRRPNDKCTSTDLPSTSQMSGTVDAIATTPSGTCIHIPANWYCTPKQKHRKRTHRR